MADNDYYWELAELNPKAIVFEEFSEAYMGVGYRNGIEPVAVYSKDFIINIIAAGMLDDEDYMQGLLDDEITEEEQQVAHAIDDANEYFNFNVAGVGSGDNNENGPIFLKAPMWDEREEGDM